MAVLGPGSDRPAAVRPAATRRTALDGFFVLPARNAAPSRQGKKAGLAVAGRRSRRSRPSGLIRPFEVAWDAPIKQTDGDHHDDRHRTRTGNAGRRKTCVRAPTEMQNATRQTTAHDFILRPPSGRAARDPLNPVRHLDVSRCSASPQRFTLAGLARESVSRRQYRGHARSMTRSDLPPIRTGFTSAGRNALFPSSTGVLRTASCFLKMPPSRA